MCLTLKLGFNSTGGSIKCCRRYHTDRKTSQKRMHGFFYIPQCRLTASGRHAESSFIYSMYYPTNFPSHSNCSSGRKEEEKDERESERARERVLTNMN